MKISEEIREQSRPGPWLATAVAPPLLSSTSYGVPFLLALPRLDRWLFLHELIKLLSHNLLDLLIRHVRCHFLRRCGCCSCLFCPLVPRDSKRSASLSEPPKSRPEGLSQSLQGEQKSMAALVPRIPQVQGPKCTPNLRLLKPSCTSSVPQSRQFRCLMKDKYPLTLWFQHVRSLNIHAI